MKFIIDNNQTKIVIGGSDNQHGNLKELLREYMTIKLDAKKTFFANRKLKQKGVKFQLKGKHCFVNDSGVFATGFLPMVASLFNDYDLDIEIDDRRRNVPIFKRGELVTDVFGFELYDHQVELIESVNNVITIGDKNVFFPRGTWKAATNSGKTAAFAGVLKNVVDPKAILIVANQDIFEQHIADFEAEFGRVGKVGKVNKKYIAEFNPFLTIAMVGSLASKLHDMNVLNWLKNKFNIKGVDESHMFSTAEATEVLTSIDAGMTIFMSGNPHDLEDRLSRFKLVGLSGNVLKYISKRFLMDNGFSMIPNINIYENPGTGIAYPNFETELRYNITESVSRAELIADMIAERSDRKVLITFFERKHGELMYNTFISKYPNLAGRCNWVHYDDKHRSEKIADYKSNRIRYLFTSTIMKQGLNIKDIQTIINAIPGKAPITLSQFLGRGERLDGINKYFEWCCFYDCGKWVSKHSLERITYYVKELLDIGFGDWYNENNLNVVKKHIDRIKKKIQD